MKLKQSEKIIFGIVSALVLIALAAMIFTSGWSNYRERLRAIRQAAKRPAELVDTREVEVAQQLAQLAVTHSEQDYAQQAMRLADHSVDLSFSEAMHDAAENPVPLTPEIKQIQERIKAGQEAVAGDQNRITQFTAALASATGSTKDDLQELIGTAQAQMALDQDDLEDAQQDLIRSGGNKQATIQQLMDQRKAVPAVNPAAQAVPSATAPSVEITQARNMVAESRAWFSLHAKEKLLLQAQQEASAGAARLSATHDALEKDLEEGKVQKEAASGESSALALLRRQTEDKGKLADLDKHIDTEKQLAAVYGKWIELVNAREKGFLHEISVSIFSVLGIVLLLLVANYWVRRLFEGVALERRQLHTLRAVILFSVQALGLILILLVILGVPGNLATVLALAGAGLTVALKDFIVGFFGWFVLMGKDGIRPGDWVEIEGIGGEVLKVGLLHTIILETGNWTDAGHPTGRKVSFVNSFAIEGHYFNFSTAGQWLWDEIQVQIPDTAEPYATAEAMRRIAADETAANARIAEAEWNRVTPAHAKGFSAAPSLSVRPTVTGVNVILRYITRANERYEVRARLYRAIVELLHQKRVLDSTLTPTTPPPPISNG